MGGLALVARDGGGRKGVTPTTAERRNLNFKPRWNQVADLARLLSELRSEAPSPGFENVLMSTSEILERMLAAGYDGSLREWNKFRNEIVKKFKCVSTTSERVALLRAYKVLMDAVEQAPGLASKDIAEINKARLSEYRLLLVAEGAGPDGFLDSRKMEEITRREIEAGRMSPDDVLRKDTVRALREMGVGVPPITRAR